MWRQECPQHIVAFDPRVTFNKNIVCHIISTNLELMSLLQMHTNFKKSRFIKWISQITGNMGFAQFPMNSFDMFWCFFGWGDLTIHSTLFLYLTRSHSRLCIDMVHKKDWQTTDPSRIKHALLWYHQIIWYELLPLYCISCLLSTLFWGGYFWTICPQVPSRDTMSMAAVTAPSRSCAKSNLSRKHVCHEKIAWQDIVIQNKWCRRV